MGRINNMKVRHRYHPPKLRYSGHQPKRKKGKHVLSTALAGMTGLFVLHWRYELPCQDKLPEFHYTPILGCIRVLWLVFHPLGLDLDKALFGWNSVTLLCISLPER